MRFPNASIIILGDFNYPNIIWTNVPAYCDPPSSECNEFLELCNDFNLTQLTTQPTRITPNTANLLDLILTTSPDICSPISYLPGISDRVVLHFFINVPLSRAKKYKKTIRDYKRADFAAINTTLCKFLDAFLIKFSERSIEENWSMFKEEVLTLTNKYIPLRIISSNNQSPWYTISIKRLANKKKRLFRAAKSSRSPERWSAYREAESNYKVCVAEAKSKFLNVTLPSMLITNPRQFWNVINSTDKFSINLRDPSGAAVPNSDCARILNEVFVMSFSGVTNQSSPIFCESGIFPMDPLFIDVNGITKIIDQLKLSSSSGTDGINSKFLKNTKIYSSIILSKLYEQSLEFGILPSDWKIGKVIALHKAGDRHSPTNYRPISLTSIPCKILEHIIASHLADHLDSNSFFTPHQHGFRKHFSCETQLLTFTHDLNLALDQGSQVDCIFLDFSKAFDKVCHTLLLFKLNELNLNPALFSWIEAFLTNRSQYVNANGNNSSFSSVTSGVPQGSVLGPLLFLIYINDLPKSVSSSISMYADDCVIYRSITNNSDISILQSDLNVISSWCDLWLMELNINKCKHMRVSRKSNGCPVYSINNTNLETVQFYKYLGLQITSNLTWRTHINYIINNANRMLGYLKRNFFLAPLSLKLLLYKTLVRSKLEYASSIWDPGLNIHISLLEAVQNRSARFILSNYHRTSSVTLMKATLSLPNLSLRRQISRLCLFHKVYHSNPILKSRLIDRPNYISQRHDHQHKVGIPQCHTNTFHMSFLPRTSVEWNRLPSSIATISDPSSFRNVVLTFFCANETML